MNRKIILLTSMMLCLISASAMAAKYKVNTSGKVTNPTGQVQQSSVIQQQVPQQINTYTAPNYTNNKIVLSNQVANIDIVMDYSGSMSNWINVAKSTMSAIVNQIPASTKIGFRVFGQDSGSNPYSPLVTKAKKIVKQANGKYKAVADNGTNGCLGMTSGSCAATAQVVPVTTYNAASLISGMNRTQIGGATPLTYALYQAVNQDFSGFPTNYKKKIILITDGDETCGGDPCAFARELVSKRKDIVIDVVLVSSYSNNLQCLATTTGGKFYNANNPYNFADAITDSIKTAPNQPQTTQPQQQSQPTQNYEYIPN